MRSLKDTLNKIENIARISLIVAAFAVILSLMATTYYFQPDRVYERVQLPSAITLHHKSFQNCHPDGCQPGLPSWDYDYQVATNTDSKAVIHDMRQYFKRAGYVIEEPSDQAAPSFTAANKHIGIEVNTFTTSTHYPNQTYDPHNLHVSVMDRSRFLK
jgi:hypothetical protein